MLLDYGPGNIYIIVSTKCIYVFDTLLLYMYKAARQTPDISRLRSILYLWITEI